MLGFLWRHPWRLPRLALLLPAAARFLLDRDRGALKGALLHASLGGCRRASLQRWTQVFLARLLRRGLYAEALRAIGTHRQRGQRLLLMSASPDLYVPQIARALGFDATICTQLRWRADGRLDGRLATANCRGEEKRRRLAELIEREAPGQISAYGNSGADLAHMALAQRAYLVNASARLRAAHGAHVQPLRWHEAGGI